MSEKIGQYEVRSVLGSGGMATVYLCYDPHCDREVAVKVLMVEFLHDPTLLARFHREAKTIASIEHPNIVPVYDFGESGGQPYIVMRYMSGGTLGERISKGVLSPREAFYIIEQLAPALDVMHAKGIVHRDVKPANILFDRTGQPFLMDFGIAKLKEASAALTGSKMIGTPAYMSPEQVFHEHEVSGRSDIYSLGAIFFEMLTGRRPYKAESPVKMIMKHADDPIPLLSEVNPALPSGLQAIIDRAMAKKPDDRYATVGEMVDDIRRILDEIEQAAAASAKASAARTSRSGIVIPVLLGVLIVALFSGWYFLVRNGDISSDRQAATNDTPDVGVTIASPPSEEEQLPVHASLDEAITDLAEKLTASIASEGFSLAIYGISRKGEGVPDEWMSAVTDALARSATLQHSFRIQDRLPINRLLQREELLEDSLTFDEKLTIAYETVLDSFLTGELERKAETCLIGVELVDVARANQLASAKTRVRVDAFPARAPETAADQGPGDLPAVVAADVAEGDATSAASTTYTNEYGMSFVPIEPGRFTMGSPVSERGRDDDELCHEVTITRPFYMQTTEVTAAQWSAIMGSAPSTILGCGGDCPVHNVSYHDIGKFMTKLNQAAATGDYRYRLPTEAEWEYACRAGSGTALPTGDMTVAGKNNSPELDELGWYSGNSCVSYAGGRPCHDWEEMQYPCSTCGPHPVAMKKANAFGLYDMIGSMWEWCQDVYGDYPAEPVTDPLLSGEGTHRVLRGGSWFSGPKNCRSASRYRQFPDYRSILAGFRLVAERIVPPQQAETPSAAE